MSHVQKIENETTHNLKSEMMNYILKRILKTIILKSLFINHVLFIHTHIYIYIYICISFVSNFKAKSYCNRFSLFS